MRYVSLCFFTCLVFSHAFMLSHHSLTKPVAINRCVDPESWAWNSFQHLFHACMMDAMSRLLPSLNFEHCTSTGG